MSKNLMILSGRKPKITPMYTTPTPKKAWSENFNPILRSLRRQRKGLNLSARPEMI
jgi:hypothetical protein